MCGRRCPRPGTRTHTSRGAQQARQSLLGRRTRRPLAGAGTHGATLRDPGLALVAACADLAVRNLCRARAVDVHKVAGSRPSTCRTGGALTLERAPGVGAPLEILAVSAGRRCCAAHVALAVVHRVRAPLGGALRGVHPCPVPQDVAVAQAVRFVVCIAAQSCVVELLARLAAPDGVDAVLGPDIFLVHLAQDATALEGTASAEVRQPVRVVPSARLARLALRLVNAAHGLGRKPHSLHRTAVRHVYPSLLV